MSKLKKTLYYANQQTLNGSIYVWGGQGEKVKSLTVKQLARMENSPANAGRVEAHIKSTLDKIQSKAKCFDCSGLVICALIYGGVLPAGYDNTAAGLYKEFEKSKLSDLQAGDLVYRENETGSITHVGIALDPETIIEARGRDYGVVKTKFNETWDRANRPKY